MDWNEIIRSLQAKMFSTGSNLEEFCNWKPFFMLNLNTTDVVDNYPPLLIPLTILGIENSTTQG
ncbi:hypothetical protein FRX31_004999 [Thalictrum thalictroides]|uniref:Uncharacterized protein n=1 Tax=Thalictrum thalictroides TaxID=46969 RepID=A0A7J6X7P8_THATH|nr:hypothetical protein FRX31_004999 [Thalictrum thalictroides]